MEAAAAATPAQGQQAQRAQRGGGRQGQPKGAGEAAGVVGREASTRQARLVEQQLLGVGIAAGRAEQAFGEQVLADQLQGEG